MVGGGEGEGEGILAIADDAASVGSGAQVGPVEERWLSVLRARSVCARAFINVVRSNLPVPDIRLLQTKASCSRGGPAAPQARSCKQVLHHHVIVNAQCGDGEALVASGNVC
jgi:hypothetical protein